MPELQSKKAQAEGLVAYLETRKGDLAAALPKHLGIDRMMRVYLTMFRKNPKLLTCDAASVYGSLLTAAQLGIEVGIANEGWLVPFYNKKRKCNEAQLIVGYGGLVNLARRSGQIAGVWANCVYKDEKHEYQAGTDPIIVHVPSPTPKRDEDLVAVYAVAEFKDGSKQAEWMWKWEIDQIRDRSRSSNDGPWVTHYAQMARKCPIRRLAKMLPASPDFVSLHTAVALDEAAESGKPQPFEFIEAEIEGPVGTEEVVTDER